MNRAAKLWEWLFPTILILFIIEVLLLPVMLGLTYATRSERPEHILTYKNAGSLSWDKNTTVRPDGSASLSFFETIYQNVNAQNAEKVLAPGTEKNSVIRLKNDTKSTIRYTAVLYELSTSKKLNIKANLEGDGFSDTSYNSLLKEIKVDTVIRTVKGSLGANKLQDFDIKWLWSFEDGSDARDVIDTYLGDKSAKGNADTATLGFYLIVHDSENTSPTPVTGENRMLCGYIILLVISGSMTLVLGISKRRNQSAD